VEITTTRQGINFPLASSARFTALYAAPESGPLLNDVVAIEDSAVIFFDVKRILTTCSSACHFHSLVVQNMFFAISEKNRKLVQKLGHMSKRTTRDKLISYLSEEAKRQHSSSFTIPFNRQQLADFLSVDRSAMSNELCRMRDEGLLNFEKNRFELW
jgi:CRP-like cAMP-binding protein